MTHEPPPPPLSPSHEKVCETPDGFSIDLRALKRAPISTFLTLSNSAHVFCFLGIKLCLKAEVTVQNGISLQKYFIEKKKHLL